MRRCEPAEGVRNKAWRTPAPWMPTRSRVFSASRNPDRNGVPEGVTPRVLDLADPAAAAPAVTAVVDAAGGLDVLVNNAGVGAVGSTEETSDDEARRILEVNLFAPV